MPSHLSTIGFPIEEDQEYLDLAERAKAEVETLGGVFDVVVDPELLPDGIPDGGVVQGVFWLTGRWLEYEKAPPGLWRRLRGR